MNLSVRGRIPAALPLPAVSAPSDCQLWAWLLVSELPSKSSAQGKLSAQAWLLGPGHLPRQ